MSVCPIDGALEVFMRTKFGLWVVTLMLLANAAAAQNSPTVLILPVEMPDHYNPVDSQQLTQALETEVQKMAPQAQLQLARAADLTAYGYQAGGEQPPSAEMADKLSRAYGVEDVAWVSIRFQPDLHADTGVLALAGAARFWVYNASQRRVAIDQPLSLVRVGQLTSPNDDNATHAQARKLALGCIGDLAYQLVGIARQRLMQPPAAVTTWTAPASDPTKSRNYKAMITATQNYQRAVRDNNLIDITSSQAAMTRAWETLNQSERDAIGKNYPDLKQAMTQVPVYQYGGYYNWGYYPYAYPAPRRY